MIYTEHDYFEAGYKYERGHPSICWTIRSMLDKEKPHDRTEARRMIMLGRTEAIRTTQRKQYA